MRNIKYLILMLGLILTNVSFAFGFEPATNDISMKFLKEIFGSLFGGGTDAFGQAMDTFNGACLIVAGTLATYTLLAGTIGTAHDGEMLGKKFSSAWLPIRYGLFTGALIPIFNGYTMAQMILASLITQGIGIADNAWSFYMNQPYQSAIVKVQETTKYDITNLAEKIFFSQMCVKANQNEFNNGNIDSILGLDKQYSYGMSFDSSTNTYNFGDTNGTNTDSNDNSCGSVKLADKVENSTIQANNSISNSGKLGALDSLFVPADVSGINTAQQTATKKLIEEMGTLADSVIKDKSLDNQKAKTYYDKIGSSVANYITTIESAGKNTAKNQSKVSEKAKEYGWAIAGSYFTNIVVTNNKISTAIGSIPTSSISYDSTLGNSKENLDKAIKILSTGNSNFTGLSASKDKEKAKADMSIDARLTNTVIKFFTKIDFTNLKNDLRHPIIVLAEMGDRLLDAYTHLIIAVLAIAVGTGAVGAIVSVFSGAGQAIISTTGTVLSAFLKLIAIPLALCLGTAITAGYIIPNLPFMMWLGIFMGWLVAVVTLIVGSGIWITFHLTPEGHDLTGKGSAGYMILLNGLIKPIASILGLIATITISGLLGEFVNKVFYQAFSYSQGDGNGLMSFFKIIIFAFIYTGIMFYLTYKSMTLPAYIADKILELVGGSDSSSSNHSNDATKAVSGAGASVLGGMAGNKANEKAFDIGQRLNNLSLKDTGAKAKFDKLKEDRLKDKKGSGGGSGDDGKGSSSGTGSKDTDFKKEPNKQGFDAFTKAKPNDVNLGVSGSTETKPEGSNDGSNGSGDVPKGSSSGTGSTGSNLNLNANQGIIKNFGRANYQDRQDEKQSFFVEIQGNNGESKKLWGDDLERAIQESNLNVGDKASFSTVGKKAVEVEDKNGNKITTHRNSWSATNLNEKPSDEIKPPTTDEDKKIDE